MPGPSYSILKNRNNMDLEFDDPILDAVDHDAHKLAEDFRAAIEGDSKRKKKKILLVFPDWIRLSAKEIHEHDDDDDKNEIFPTLWHNNYNHVGTDGNNSKHYLVFNVARKDVMSYKKGKVENKEKKSRLKAQISSPPPYGGGGGGDGGAAYKKDDNSMFPDYAKSG
jgi:hypothetical protein